MNVTIHIILYSVSALVSYLLVEHGGIFPLITGIVIGIMAAVGFLFLLKDVISGGQ